MSITGSQGLSGSKSHNGQTTGGTTGLDPATQAQMNAIFQASRMAGNSPGPGVDPLSTAAGQSYSGYSAGGQQGLAALMGDPNAVSAMSNPYTQQVINANNDQWQHINQQGTNQINSNATLAGAFGGSRQGVAQGTMLSQNNQAQAQQNAGLLSQGYQDAMGNATTLAGMGLQGAAGQQQIGDYTRGVTMQTDPNTWRLNQLRNGLTGLPYGTTNTQHTVNSGTNMGGTQGSSMGMSLGGMMGG